MGIWEILGIEPTTDKRQIKKAYAARSKEIHPEERQEEFMQLYAAYQAALQYAQRGRRYQSDGRSGPATEDERNVYGGKGQAESGAEKDSTGREAAGRTKWEENELSSYFENRAEERNEKIAFFMERWENVKSMCRDPEERRWWKDYLESEDFQDIKWHPALVEFLGEDMERQLSDDYVIRLYFWDAYGFQAFEEEEGCGYPVSLQKLWWALYPAAWHRRYQYQEIDRLAVKWRLEREQERRKIVRMIFLALVAVGLFFFIKNVSMSVKGSRYAETYMRDRYPQETFSKPERVGKTKDRAVYEMNSLSHPEINVQVEIDYGFHNEIYGANENYGLQLLQYYGEGYGLTCGEITKRYPSREKVCVLYYSDEDALGEFCGRVNRMFEEHEVLQELEAVGICKEGVLYPDAFVNGGVKGCRPMKEQFYRPWEVESGQMEEMVREGLVGYMFHFEPWNLTPEQYWEWGPAYREMCEDVEKDYTSGFWYHLRREDGASCDLYIPVYSYEGYEAFAEGKYFTKSTDMLLVGDAYFFLMAGGVSPKPAGDGSGFLVEKDGESCFFGENAEEKLGAVRGFINAHE